MVTPVSSLSRNGLSDWVVQRVSAVILLAYTLLIAGFVFFSSSLDYQSWVAFFGQLWVKIATLLALLSLCAHAWIGLWTIATDYLTPRMLGGKATVIRFIFLLLAQGVIFVYLVWGIQILWGVSA